MKEKQESKIKDALIDGQLSGSLDSLATSDSPDDVGDTTLKDMMHNGWVLFVTQAW